MHTDSWIKTTNIRLFGIKIYQKEEICTEQNYDNEIIQVNVTPEYFNSEFKVDKKDRQKNDTN